ncbi:MAG TPA: hypothetical protein VHB21_00610, partial [Minicystis sp.]|nr:hypothetical protein [Minicystis sp.]
MSSERRAIIPPPNPHGGDEPDSIGPTTSLIPPPPPPAPPRANSLFPSARATITSLIPPAARKSIASMLPAARASIPSMLPVWKPRWTPWSPQRALAATMGFAVAFGVFFYLAYPRLAKYAHRFYMRTDLTAAAAAAAPEVTPVAAPVDRGDADKNLVRQNRSPVAGGLLSIPPSFHSGD